MQLPSLLLRLFIISLDERISGRLNIISITRCSRRWREDTHGRQMKGMINKLVENDFRQQPAQHNSSS